MSDRHRVVVTALIWRLRPDRLTPEVLMMKRPSDAEFFPDVWVAPGGGVEIPDFNGTADGFGTRALYREVGEELGADVLIWRPRLFGHRGFVRSDGTGVVVLTYEARWESGDPQVTPEAVEFAWVADIETGGYELIGDTAQEIADLANHVRPF